ncbi:MAG: carbamoyltransferase HypF [candidate division WOR-3 bacterium]
MPRNLSNRLSAPKSRRPAPPSRNPGLPAQPLNIAQVTTRERGRRSKAILITVSGRVQGIGFRPWVYRTAVELGLVGTVYNSGSEVVIHAQGARRLELLHALHKHPPRLAKITGITVQTVSPIPLTCFQIVPSIKTEPREAQLVPDLATCINCRREIVSPRARRFHYPFANCTECGPRYSIITDLPYDRPNTTMRSFTMCADCRREYEDPANRRFHAQPIACPACGPELILISSKTSSKIVAKSAEAIAQAARSIIRGQVLAIKGLGGFHLMCDAGLDSCIRRIRQAKSRDTKPLAIMCPNIGAIRKFCNINMTEQALLKSSVAPIVLLPKRNTPKASLSGLVAPANNYLGVMLPYTPLHYLLFKELNRLGWRGQALVATSANRKDEPIATTEAELQNLSCHPLILTNNRPIANRCDDSLVAVPSPRLGHVIIRRSRGFVPEPIRINPAFHVKRPVLAVGADHHGAFVLAAGEQAWFGPYTGTPSPGASEESFLAALRRLEHWTGIKPELVACDLHPDYWSSRLAEKLAAERGVQLVRVQHHFAHALSAAAEIAPTPATRRTRSDRTLALVCDGAGLGLDGHIWGCEFLLIEQNHSWARVGHLREAMLSGGVNEGVSPSLIAAEWLQELGMLQERKALGLPEPVSHDRRLPTSSLGRLFDAVAAITGVCRRLTYSGEAAVALEAAAFQNGPLTAPLVAARTSRQMQSDLNLATNYERSYEIDPTPILRQVVCSTIAGVNSGRVALWFHMYLANTLRRAIRHLSRRYHTNRIVLSGGSFHNRLLLNRLSHTGGMRVIINHASPPGDGGIALGQAVAAGSWVEGSNSY